MIKELKFREKVLIGLILLAIVSVWASFYYFRGKKLPTPSMTVSESYGQVYRLVAEKISQSALVIINLPPNTKASEAQKNIAFTPDIYGQWVKSENESQLIFKPLEKLNIDRYYSVALAMGEKGNIQADFLAVEDPRVIAIFPAVGSETAEDSEITIIFNRPMVPLTALGYLESKALPIEITPATEGRFKWITTRNLQFIPKEKLKRSSNYTVMIKAGMLSADNLPIEEYSSTFVTRKLRYENATQDARSYDAPISFVFNQPVDLERTRSEISLKDLETGNDIPFVAEYATTIRKRSADQPADSLASKLGRLITGTPETAGDTEEVIEINQSIINIYNARDKFGREKVWDYSSSYRATFKNAYPVEGDINLDQEYSTMISTESPIRDVRVESSRFSPVSHNFFDPQGKAWITFSEETDLAKSDIVVSKMKGYGYGEKCEDENKNIQDDPDCKKIPDKKKFWVIFNSGQIGLSEDISIVFKSIINLNGYTINKDTITESFRSYPQFQILRSSPSSGLAGTSLKEIKLCSTTPISVPPEKELGNHIKASHNYVLNYWGNPQRVDNIYEAQSTGCNIGDFSARINYGLDPETEYAFDFKFEDAFGQKADYSIKFTSGLMNYQDLSFYHLQEQYNITMPGKTKLTYAARNMDYVDMEICKLDPLDFTGYLENGINMFDSPRIVTECKKTIKEKIEMPKRYWTKNYFNISLEKYFPASTGHYIVTFSNPNYLSSRWVNGSSIIRQVYERTYLTVTNLGLAEKRINLDSVGLDTEESLPTEKDMANFYWVTDLTSLEPVSGAKINLYHKDGSVFKLLATYATDEKGVVVPKAADGIDEVIVSKGNDSAIILQRESNLNYASLARKASKYYLYTDKPIYQPTQTVFFKGLYRIGYDGNYEIFRDKTVHIRGVNSKGGEIYSADLEVGDFGTFDAKLILDKASPLGSYSICVEAQSCTSFEVQEYVPSPFKVGLKSDKEEYVSKDTANVAIAADYYFGVPLESGTAEYTISSQNYYFDRYSDGYFDFGTGWYYGDYYGGGYYGGYSYGDKFISEGSVELSKDGKANISQELDIDKLFPKSDTRQSKIIVVDVTVKNSNGQSVSAQKSFIVHAGEFYLGITSDRYFMAKNQNMNLQMKSVDTQGKPVSIQNIKGILYRINWVYNKRQEATGGYSSNWERQRKEVSSFQFNTDEKGNYSKDVSFAEEGEYEAEINSADSRGNAVKSVLSVYIYGEREVSIQPQEGTALEIDSKKTALNVGDRGDIIIKSPYAKAKALISVERGKVFSYEIVDIQGNIFSYSFDVMEKYSPNFYVSVLLVSSKPEIRFGQKAFTVDTARQKLNIGVKSDKKFYLPGEEVTLDISTTDFTGRPVKAEVSAAVVDLSVLALQGNPKKNPITFFYGGFPLTVSTFSNIKNILVESNVVETKGGGGGAGELETKKRGEFKENAFWQAAVRTDENGKAAVKFKLPDNLTTWQTETLGITKDTKVGVNYLEFTTKKQLMAVPLKPRFIVPGDQFSVGAQIFNQTAQRQEVSVNFFSPTLVVKNDTADKKIIIEPDQSATVYYSAEAPAAMERGIHVFTLAAKGQGVEDTVEQSISITPNDTYEATATANYTSSPLSHEYVFLPENIIRDKGSLTVKSSATLAVFMSDSLKYLLEYPYGCSEQVSSKLNSIAIVKRGLNLPNMADKFNLGKIMYDGQEYTVDQLVEIGLAKLYNNQHSDGGFGLWQNYDNANFYTTLQVVETLNNLKQAGYAINEDSLSRAATYLYGRITTDRSYYLDRNNLIMTSYVLFSLDDPKYKNDYALNQKIRELANDDLFINEQISNTSLAYLGIMAGQDLGNGFSGIGSDPLRKKILDTLDNRINIDSRGSFLEVNKNRLWYYYETPIKNTSLYLKAIVANKSNNPIADKVLRWLLASRSKDGSWGSTNNTLYAVDAFVDYLSWKRETESDFVLDITVNQEKQSSFHFNKTTILDQNSKQIPLNFLKFNENNTVLFSKQNKNNLPNSLYYDMSLKYYLPQDAIAPRDEGFSITREFYGVDDLKNETPLKEAKVGDVLREHLVVTVSETRNFVGIEDFIPAGMEIVNLDLATEQKSLRMQDPISQARSFYPDFKELRNDRAFLYQDSVAPGVYEFDYYTRALIKGKFTRLPAVVSEMYFPENFGRTAGGYFEIK